MAFDEMRACQTKKKRERWRKQYQWHRRVVPIFGAKDSAPNVMEAREKQTVKERRRASRPSPVLRELAATVYGFQTQPRTCPKNNNRSSISDHHHRRSKQLKHLPRHHITREMSDSARNDTFSL
jgi:hypothetical protein